MSTTRLAIGWAALIRLGLGIGIGTASLVMMAAPSIAQDPTRLDRAPEEVAAIGSKPSRITPEALGGGGGIGSIKAVPRAKGTPSIGLKVTLDGSGSSGGRVWYRWLQTQGPKVVIDDPSQAVSHFTVPTDASVLGFVLVVGDATGVDARYIQVDVDDTERKVDDATLKADAGDDQTSKVGRRVILNGVRSEPKGKLKYRWIQSGGPKVALKSNDGPTSSFVPSMPGTYQFSLIVATPSGLLSEPAEVTITVSGVSTAKAGRDPVEGSSMAIDELARASLGSIEGGSRFADDLSRVFDLAADRIESFKTYKDAVDEMTRRLDVVVPRDKERRVVWIEKFFGPLMAKIASGFRLEGIDITQPENQTKPLTSAQRARLAEQFRFAAAGLRSARAVR